MSVRENFTVQLQLPDRLECPQDYEDVYGAFEREANEYARKRTKFEDLWDEKNTRRFVTYWWSGSLESSRERLAELFGPLGKDQSIDGYISSIVSALEGSRKGFRAIREALGVRDRDEPGYWWHSLENLATAVWDTVHKSTKLGESLRGFVQREAESHFPISLGEERVRLMFAVIQQAREVAGNRSDEYRTRVLQERLAELDASKSK